MAVPMKRSTNTAPVSWSISYLIGSALAGISMMTLNTSGALAPAGTLSRLMMMDHKLGNLGDGKCRRCRPSLGKQTHQVAQSQIFDIRTTTLLHRTKSTC